MIDPIARDIAVRRWGLPECLHVPIAAVDEHAIRAFVGDVVQPLGGRSSPRALLVQLRETPQEDRRFPIWGLDGSKVFHQKRQLWVDVTYTRYRPAYRLAFPDDDITSKIISHAMNRRLAAHKGFRYVRVTATSRGANSSSAFSEGWGVALHGSGEAAAAARRGGASIQCEVTDGMRRAGLGGMSRDFLGYR